MIENSVANSRGRLREVPVGSLRQCYSIINRTADCDSPVCNRYTLQSWLNCKFYKAGRLEERTPKHEKGYLPNLCANRRLFVQDRLYVQSPPLQECSNVEFVCEWTQPFLRCH